MTEQTNPLLEIDLGENGGRFVFYKFDEIQNWLNAEKAFWSWVIQSSNSGEMFSRIRSLIKGALNPIQDTLNQLVPIKSINAQLLAELKKFIITAYENKRIPHSSTPRAKFVEDIRKKDTILASSILWYFLGVEFDNRIASHALEGVFLAIAFDHGLADTATSQKEALGDLLREWRGLHSSAKEELESWVSKSKMAREDLQTLRKNQETEFENLLDTSRIQLEDLRNHAVRDLANVTKTYDDKLALQASVRYWKNKAISHSWFSIITAIICIILGYGVGELLYRFIRDVVGNVKLVDVQLWQVGLIGVVATFGVWIIRVFVRILLSNVHLFTEANERRTMLLTYLALLRKGQLPEGQERQLILQVLFRPSSTGIIKDDATPPFIAEWIKRTIGTD